jgi:hypothetical protein
MMDSAHALRIVWALVALLSAIVLVGSLYKWRHGQPVDAALVCVALSGVLTAAVNTFTKLPQPVKLAAALVSVSLALVGALIYFV